MATGRDNRSAPMKPEIRWLIGVIVGLTAMLGLIVLVVLVSLWLGVATPQWLQVLIGVALVAIPGLLTWLVASALGQRDKARAAEDEVEARSRSAPQTPRPTSSR